MSTLESTEKTTMTTRTAKTTKPKRGHHEGSIAKRSDGRWHAAILQPDGTRKYFYGKTRQEVTRRLLEARHELEHGLPLLDERQTVRHYLEAWLETVQPQIRASSWRRYGNYVRVHLVPSLGRIPLAKLTPQHLQLLYARKLGEGLSPTTVHHLHGMLHRAMKDALRMGLVQRNVTEQVRAPRRGHHEMLTFSEAEAKRFLATVAGDRFEALYLLALTTGMRQGELLALRWQDLELERARLHVRMNVQEAHNRFILAEPKTTYSRRTIALTARAVSALRAHQTRQASERQTAGDAWNARLDLVFPNTLGGLMIPDNLAKRSFKRLLRQAALPEMRFHDLRHTAATLLISGGVHPKVVSEMLGHADISITLRVYAHVTPHMQQAAVAVMEDLFGDVIMGDDGLDGAQATQKPLHAPTQEEAPY